MPKKNSNTPVLVEHSFQSKNIAQRAEDGYFSATDMCKVANKKISHYRSIAQTKDFLNALSNELGISTDELMQVHQGGRKGKQGTWVHPRVAIHLAQWLSPEFSVAVSGIVFNWMNAKAQPEKEKQQPLLPDNTKRHVWMVLNNTGTVQSQVDLPDAHAVSEKVTEHFPEYVLLDRDKIMKDLDQVIYQMMVAQNEIRTTLNPLITALGTSKEKDADTLWNERVKKAGDRLAEAV